MKLLRHISHIAVPVLAVALMSAMTYVVIVDNSRSDSVLSPPSDGRDGVGVARMVRDPQTLDVTIYYTDGRSENIGHAPPIQGESIRGPQGPPGRDGNDGSDGSDGQDGADGRNGNDGLSGLSIIGPKGDKGDQGNPGTDGANGRTPELSCVLRWDDTIASVTRYFVAWKYTDEQNTDWRNLSRISSEDRPPQSDCIDLRA